MQPLPRDFLTDIARKYMLSLEQEEAFVELYSGDGNKLEVAKRLHIGTSTLSTRMTEVYRKFSISGKGPGKFRELQVFLLQRYQKSGEPLPEAAPTVDIAALVQDCRQKVKPLIQERCGKMNVLHVEQPVELGQIYINVNILEELSGQQRLELSDLLETSDPEDFDRIGLGEVRERRVPGLEAIQRHQKLMVLGKPGSGKTTFLNHLAIACCNGTVLTDQLPIFVPLKEFAETKGQPELLTYILEIFEDVSSDDFSLLLKKGKIFFLLDGLDEVREKDTSRVTREIQKLADKHYGNHYVVTCRIAARGYVFQQFTEVEVADFDDRQILQFARNWFHKHPGQAEKFAARLQENKRIHELGTNPLLLTLLCLIFGKQGKFKDSRAELYEEGIELLLEEWDVRRNIEREQVYRRLVPKRKMDLLSYIALNTFTRSEYFFKKRRLEHLISTYIQTLPDVQNDPDGLLISSEEVLTSIVAQHGLLTERATRIYSFSHLTFQEYFAARQIAGSNSERANQYLNNLVVRITEQRWREVFLLVSEMLPDSSFLMKLMKAQVDSLLAEDERLQEFLCWLRNKQLSVEVPYQPSAVGAFYLALALTQYRDYHRDFDVANDFADDLASNRYFYLTYDLAQNLDPALSHNLVGEFAYELRLDLSLSLALNLSYRPDLDHVLNFVRDFDRVINLARTLARIRALDHSANPELMEALRNLEEHLPNSSSDVNIFNRWWSLNGEAWTGQFRAAIIEHRSIGHNWQFSNEQKERLQQYYDANKLLVECLNGECSVTNDVRAEIEETLLLPISEIEQRQSQ